VSQKRSFYNGLIFETEYYDSVSIFESTAWQAELFEIARSSGAAENQIQCYEASL